MSNKVKHLSGTGEYFKKGQNRIKPKEFEYELEKWTGIEDRSLARDLTEGGNEIAESGR